MSEQAPETPVNVSEPRSGDDFDDAATPPEGQQKPEPKTFDESYVTNLRKEAAKYRTEAKAAAAELEKTRKASMGETERQIAEAKAAGFAEASTEYSRKFARASFDALAARRNPDVDTDPIVEFMDMSRFVGEDGEVDSKALTAAVERLVPERPTGPPSQDGGVRTTSAPTDMNEVIRRQARVGRSA